MLVRDRPATKIVLDQQIHDQDKESLPLFKIIQEVLGTIESESTYLSAPKEEKRMIINVKKTIKKKASRHRFSKRLRLRATGTKSTD